MSYFHQDNLKSKEQLLAYINGFLWTLEMLNDYCDHGQTYYVQEIDRTSQLEKAIKDHLNDGGYEITYAPTFDWRQRISASGRKFFTSWLGRLKYQFKTEGFSEGKFEYAIQNTIEFEAIIEQYMKLLELLIPEDSSVYEVFVDSYKGKFYENDYNDYVVDNGLGRFFIHFGESD